MAKKDELPKDVVDPEQDLMSKEPEPKNEKERLLRKPAKLCDRVIYTNLKGVKQSGIVVYVHKHEDIGKDDVIDIFVMTRKGFSIAERVEKSPNVTGTEGRWCHYQGDQ